MIKKDNLYRLVLEKFDKHKVNNFVNLSSLEYDDLPEVVNKKHIIWKHISSTNGASTGIHLYCNSEIVGRILLQPKLLNINGRYVAIAIATDALVHPKHRRPIGNFLSIVKKMDNMSDFDFILHTSNEASEGIYKKILKIKNPFSLTGYITPVDLHAISKKYSRILALAARLVNKPYRLSLVLFCKALKIVTELKVTDKEPNVQEFDALCERNALHYGPEIKRSKENLKWRFSDSPLWKGEILYIYKHIEFVGYIVIRHVKINGLEFTVLMDYSISSELSLLEVMSIRASIIEKSIKKGDSAVFTLANSHAKSTKKNIGFPFISIPDKYLPHRVPFYIHANKNLDELKTWGNLNLLLSDLDYF